MKNMFKKTLYPFTDWNWLKLPLASLAVGGCFAGTVLACAASAAYHGDHPEAAVTAFIIGYFALFGMWFLFNLACWGYIVRIARQASSDQPHKLPKWSQVGGLIREGLALNVGLAILEFAGLVFIHIPYILIFLGSALFGGTLAHFEWEKTGITAVLLGGGVAVGVLVFLIFVMMIALAIFYPLMIARYAHTGKFKHLLSPRWAWNAFAVAPWNYLGRTSVWTVLLTVITILTPLTAGGAYLIGILILPLALINTVYLVGDYYREYLDD
jgi:Protein of unknown function (DUF4013)